MAAVKMSGRIYEEDDDERDELEEPEELDDEQGEGEEELEEEQDEQNECVECKEGECADGLLAELAEAERVCECHEREVNKCRSALKLAKADFDSAVSKLRRLAKAVKDDDERPLMPAFKAAEKKAATEDSSGKSSDGWRDAPLGDLAIPDGLIEKLYESGIDTVGELEDLRAEISQGKSKWPKGIGPAKVTTIEDAVLQWLAVNQQ